MPDHHPSDERYRTLTDADINAITHAFDRHPVCNLGLTADEVSTLKRVLGTFDKAAGIVGKLILTAIVVFLIAIFTQGFWISLATGIKQGASK